MLSRIIQGFQRRCQGDDKNPDETKQLLAMLETDKPEQKSSIGLRLVDVIDTELPVQPKEAVNVNRHLQGGLYMIIADSAELPPDVRIPYDVPETCRTWEDLWQLVLERQLPRAQGQVDFFLRLQRWYFEQALIMESSSAKGSNQRLLSASTIEVENARRRLFGNLKPEYEIVAAIIRTKSAVWDQLMRAFEGNVMNGGHVISKEYDETF